MKTILLLAICLQVAVAATVADSNSAQIYLPPRVDGEATTVPPTPPSPADHADELSTVDPTVVAIESKIKDEDATVVGDEGYMYKTVRRLRYRQRRDVSHLKGLNRDYLPPHIRKPATHYLPPIESATKMLPKVNNEYLPPVVVTSPAPVAYVEPSTLAPTTEAPATVPPTTTTVPETTTITAIEEEQEVEATETPTTTTAVGIVDEPIEETAILADDGYHYKRPDVIPDLSPIRDYLPPLEEAVIVDEADSPDNDVSAVLADDGYHYRAIRRFRF